MQSTRLHKLELSISEASIDTSRVFPKILSTRG